MLLFDGQWLIILDLLEIVVKVFCPALDDVIVFAHDLDVLIVITFYLLSTQKSRNLTKTSGLFQKTSFFRAGGYSPPGSFLLPEKSSAALTASETFACASSNI